MVALDGVDLDIEPGQVHGLVGPNGAGKTTLLSLVLGLLVPDRGTLEILGRSTGPTPRTVEGVAGFVEAPGVYPALTARQNLTTLTSLTGSGTAADVSDALDRLGLTGVADDRVSGFSLGMRQRLGLAASLLSRPRVLVLDEPANGLDPVGQRLVHGVLADLAASGATVIFSSHRMDDVAAVCAQVTLMAAGRVVFTGPPSSLADDTAVLDYRLVASDRSTAMQVSATTPGVTLLDVPSSRASEELLLRAAPQDLGLLQVRLVQQGVTLRELTPVVPVLEAAFLRLTGSGVGQS